MWPLVLFLLLERWGGGTGNFHGLILLISVEDRKPRNTLGHKKGHQKHQAGSGTGICWDTGDCSFEHIIKKDGSKGFSEKDGPTLLG